ncbi:cell division protein FtsX, partial [Salipiger sp. HF18]|uniref:FtsX-like permease family protein n=1 Tax=Salipiger sp. HF18 TaxID=2721557 RepID=UPI0016AB9B88|nr:cell division protein FtsX [Salipiger sp. HF18]
NAALAANAQVIAVLRLVGATDAYIARAFVRRFTLRALSGAAVGTVLGIGAVLLMPPAGETAGFLTGLGFRGWHWVVPLLVPPLAAAVAFVATAVAARRVLGGLS